MEVKIEIEEVSGFMVDGKFFRNKPEALVELMKRRVDVAIRDFGPIKSESDLRSFFQQYSLDFFAYMEYVFSADHPRTLDGVGS